MINTIKDYLYQNWHQILPDKDPPRSLQFFLICGGLGRNAKASYLVFDEGPYPFMVIRLSDDECGKSYLKQEWDNLLILTQKYRMDTSVPKPIHIATIGKYLLVFESYIGGTSIAKRSNARLFCCVIDWLIDFHAKTKQVKFFSTSNAKEIETQINLIVHSIEMSPILRSYLEEVKKEVQTCLLDKNVTYVFSHNDFSPQNILCRTDAECLSVIDWEHSEPEGMPLGDLYHFITYYYPVTTNEQFLTNLQRAFYQKNRFSLLVREKIIQYCNRIGLTHSLAKLFFLLHLICPLEESLKLSMPFYPLWHRRLYALEFLAKCHSSLQFIV